MVKGKDNRSSFKGLKWGGWGDSLVILAPFETHRAWGLSPEFIQSGTALPFLTLWSGLWINSGMLRLVHHFISGCLLRLGWWKKTFRL